MGKLFKTILIVCILGACKKEQPIMIIPECLLTEQEMINVMVDVSLVKSAKSLGRQGLRDSGIKPIEYLYAKHGVDTIVIRENLEYYNSDLKKSKKLQEDVAAILKERQEILHVVMDSLAKTIDEDSQEEDLEEEEAFDDDER